MFGLFKARRRRRLRAQPLPSEWARILEGNVSLYQRLPEADREELQGHTQVFLAEKRFEGCGGQEIADEVRLTIASQACILLLHRETDYFPTVSSILVYPEAYMVKAARRAEHGLVSESEEAHLGEAWDRDLLVLSWEDAQAAAKGWGEGANVVLHEFAHALDDEDGAANGAPTLPDRKMYATWARVMKSAYEQLKEDAESGRETLIDEYGAESPAEFFAVATEAFFETPVPLRQSYPKLYEQLKMFYEQDPAAWEASRDI